LKGDSIHFTCAKFASAFSGLAGNKKSEQRANNQLITYDSYDEMNRLTK